MSPGASRADSGFVVSEPGARSVWGKHLLSGLKAVLHPEPQPDRKRKTWPPISLAVLDMANAASLLGAGDWIDQTSRLTMIMSWGGHHKLLLIISIAGFVLLATLASITKAFAAPSDLQFALIVFACMTSIVALSGALAVLLLAAVALIFLLLLAVAVLILVLLPVIMLVLLLGQRRR
jgi:hypothetical protein